MDDQIPERHAMSSSLSGTALLIKFRALRTEQAENAPQDSGGHYRQIHLNSRHSNANGPLFSTPSPAHSFCRLTLWDFDAKRNWTRVMDGLDFRRDTASEYSTSGMHSHVHWNKDVR
ncbi:hypothetical protein CDAR_293421 [Caerostris darwini]|uniref:Uncharacterized protein n=1 Tax=Caerostris darwini TaxID=1538125 RepID=A0AAV4RKB8_9ARAC|nr:hypothetical protein CDAR_293421 [Caerostris darwini]